MNYVELNNEIIKAMKARDNHRRDTLRAVLNEVKNIEVNERRAVDDKDIDAMIKRVMKQTKESYDASIKAANNDERTCSLLKRIEILNEYMPQIIDMSAGLDDCIDKIISENFTVFTKKDIGKVMKIMSDKYDESFDKKQAADYLKSISSERSMFLSKEKDEYRSKKINEVKDYLTIAAIYEQLAEEASELSQAAIKMSRIIRGENPTPVNENEAAKNIIEEYNDVILCAKILDIGDDDNVLSYKLNRWCDRLENRYGDR